MDTNGNTHKPLTLLSLFDGSGGFCLGALLSGIQPVGASEIEPFAIRVTTKRLPFVKHYGDVTVLSGAELPPVDIITFGSPCQDMSIAGKREGLGGSRSNLFFEAVRIVKEMRKATDENIPLGCAGKTCRELSRRTPARISKPSSTRSAGSKTPKLILLDLRSGRTQDCSWLTITASHGGYLTLSTSEFPNAENASTLSAILQVSVPEKYYLSRKACLGILRRASARGKELPELLGRLWSVRRHRPERSGRELYERVR